MKTFTFLIGLSLCCKFSVFSRKIIDLSYDFGPKSISWPGNPSFNLSHLLIGKQPGGFWLEKNWFSSNEHRGTHIDAPAHFYFGSLHIHQIPLDDLIGPGIVIRATKEANENNDFVMNKDFILNWEAENGQIPHGAIILLDFDWARRYLTFDENIIFGTKTVNDVSSYHYPGIGPDAMTYLVKEKHIKAIGTDATSPDAGQAVNYPSHRICGRYNTTIIENVANLASMPIKGSTVFLAAIKLKGGSGVPARVFAILDDDSCNMAATNIMSSSLFTIMIVFSIVNCYNGI
ncbi:hypothetical protein SNE40_020858 [Patella caerulea]|uniref:Cyclase n=1 Tax=Patella caerulea TaxID=87958 RepID=A0AAN8PBV4_PATCE